MYQTSYAEVLADSAMDGRREECRALDHAIMLLKRAQMHPPRSEAEREALNFTVQLWGIFVNSLSSPENDLPERLRASLISVGLGVMKEATRIERGESRDLAALADICGIIRDGLA